MSRTPGTRREGDLDARGKRFAIVASRFNESVVDRLLAGARETLERRGAAPGAIAVYRVPGALEIPPVARRLVKGRRFDAVICLGAVIRGATPHFEYVAAESARGVADAGQKGRVPVIFGVLTTNTVRQAVDRARPGPGNKGAEAALAALEMASLYASLAAEEAALREQEDDGEEEGTRGREQGRPRPRPRRRRPPRRPRSRKERGRA